MADIARLSEIEPDAPALEGVSRLSNYLWSEVWKHADGTANGDADALHDMRVALRRLRSLLQNFAGEKDAPILTPALRKEFRVQRAALGKLGDALGAVRDYDVLDEYLKTYAKKRLKTRLDSQSQEYSGLLAFERFLQNGRADAFAPMVKKINKARRAGNFQEEFGRWALGLPAAFAPHISLSEIARRLLPIRLDEILSHASSLEETHVEEEQHELRKSLRRLRYTFETLGPCFAGDAKPFIKILVRLQDLLGEMQDRAVLHEKALQAFGIEAGSTPDTKAAGDLPEDVSAFLQYGKNRRARLLGQVRKEWHAQQDAEFFEKLRNLQNSAI
jgi:CHAD domain-containing protein